MNTCVGQQRSSLYIDGYAGWTSGPLNAWSVGLAARRTKVLYIIIHTGLVVAKIKSCIPRAL